jgi:hypothetical protein
MGAGGARVVRFIDPNGNHCTAVFAGPGSANLTFNGPNLSQATSHGVSTLGGTPLSASLSTTGTTSATSLSIVGGGGNGFIHLTGITTDANIGVLGTARVSVTGDVTVAGTIRSLSLGSITGGTLTITGTTGTATLNLGTTADLSVNSSEAIQSLSATSFGPSSSDVSEPAITAPSIARLAVRTNLGTDITTTGNVGPVTAGTITTGNWSIGGSIASVSAASITDLMLTAGDLRTIISRGAISDSHVVSTGNVSLISAVSMSGSQFSAGVTTPGNDNIPSGFSTAATITSVSVGRGGFSNSVIAAQTLNHVALGAFSSSNDGTRFGVAASKIALLTATIDGKRLTLSRVTTAQQVTDALTKASITPIDLVIQIE